MATELAPTTPVRNNAEGLAPQGIAPAGAVDEGALVRAPAGNDQFGDGNDHALAGPSVARIRTLRWRGVKLWTTIAPLVS